jgi:hypothetical protein
MLLRFKFIRVHLLLRYFKLHVYDDLHLLKSLSWGFELSLGLEIKIFDRTMMMFVHYFSFLEALFSRIFFAVLILYLVVVKVCCCMCLVTALGSLFFFGCVYLLMFSDNLLVQRLCVISIFTILISFLYQKCYDLGTF